MPITHEKVLSKADDPAELAAGEVVPSHWNAEHVGNGLDYFNVRDFAVGGFDGIADDQPAVQAAIEAANAAGGGFVWIPPNTRARLDTLAVNVAGSEAHLWNPHSSVSIIGAGRSSVLYADDDYSILYQGGTAKFVDATVYTITAAIAKDAMSLTLATAADASNFQAGDHIYIRTGQTIGAGGSGLVKQPDAEINRVVTANSGTGVIELAWPTAKAYAQEYFISGTSGLSSTSVTANAAVFGVSNIEALITTDQVYRDIRFEHDGTGDTCYGVIGGQVVRCLMDNISWSGKTGFQSVGAWRDYTIRDSVFDHPGDAGLYIYTFTADSGCVNGKWTNNSISGEHVVSSHIQEGAARVQVIGNTWACPDSVADVNFISCRSRCYDTLILGNTISGATPSAIVVDPTCKGGGVIADNQLLGTTGFGVFVASENWVVSANRHPNGAVQYAEPTTGLDADVRMMSAWVSVANQTVILGYKPQNVWVKDIQIQVTQAFNSSGTDTISVGFDADNTGFAAATDVSTTGFKTPTLGGYAGYSPGNHGFIKAYYVNGGGEPTTGKALVTFQYVMVAQSP
jgi:hypothetical protein